MHPAKAIRPARGPRWTRKRLIGMLLDCYGPTARGSVDIAAVADYAGVSPSTVRRWISSGLLTAHRVGPRLIRVDRESILRLANPIGGAARA